MPKFVGAADVGNEDFGVADGASVGAEVGVEDVVAGAGEVGFDDVIAGVGDAVVGVDEGALIGVLVSMFVGAGDVGDEDIGVAVGAFVGAEVGVSDITA